MNEKQITRINGVEILTVERNGEVYVPIKPICAALGVNYSTQLEKIQADETFSESTVPLRGMVASDGKAREMICLPLWLCFLWLGTINPKNVAESVRPAVISYRIECAKALYEHFAGSLRRQVETNRAEIEALQAVNNAILREKEAKTDRRKAEEHLAKVRAARLDDTPTLFS